MHAYLLFTAFRFGLLQRRADVGRGCFGTLTKHRVWEASLIKPCHTLGRRLVTVHVIAQASTRNGWERRQGQPWPELVL